MSKSNECTTSRENPNVNHGLWVQNVDTEGGGVGAGGIWEFSTPSAQFCC